MIQGVVVPVVCEASRIEMAKKMQVSYAQYNQSEMSGRDGKLVIKQYPVCPKGCALTRRPTVVRVPTYVFSGHLVSI